MNRMEILKALIKLDRPVNRLISLMSECEWDSEAELVVLTAEDMVNILERYCQGKISKDNIDQWANLIECRDDIGFDSKSVSEIKKIIYELANSSLTQALSKDRAQEIIGILKSPLIS